MTKKILQINTVCGVGSTGRIATDLSNVIEKNGFESYIAYGYGKCNSRNTIKIGSKLEYYLHNILSKLTGKQGRFSLFATNRFINKIKKINPDIIHLHNIHGNYINYQLLFNYIKQKNIPVVWTLHDCWSFTGKCTHFDFVGCDKWIEGCKNCSQIHEYPKSYVIDSSRKEYEIKKKNFTRVENMHIVTPSKWLSIKVKQSFLAKYPIHVINNGIDLNKFTKKESNLRKQYDIEEKFVILGVASEWGKRKGLDTFIALANMLDKKYQIVIVGLDEKQCKELPDDIIKITKTNSIEELAEIYNLADVFINPTIEDNYPTTNLEAIACGTPVITYNTGGSPESITSECGIVVDKGNIEQLLYAIKELKDKKNLKEENCLKLAEKFDKNICFEQYIELYKQILKKKREE